MSRILSIVLLAVLAQSAGHAETLYRLDGAATFQHGCFEPCRCVEPGPEITIRGTFVLGPAVPGDVFDFHEISELYWTASDTDNPVHGITGSGTYKVSNFSPKRQQMLELELAIDGSAPVYFFSELAPATKGPVIDLLVSQNGVYCYDTLLRVVAEPVPLTEITHYALDADSSFQQGCFDPCDCLLEKPRPMTGDFALVPLFIAGNYDEYALVNAAFSVPEAGPDLPGVVLSGTGRYIVIQGFAGPAQTMELLLDVNGFGPVLFDKSLDNTTTLFPDIDIAVDMNDRVCFDQILTISAAPSGIYGSGISPRLCGYP